MVENDSYILGLDVSTKTIGISLFKDLGDKGELVYLQHVSPNIKPKPKNKLEELFHKSAIFEKQYLLTKLANSGLNIKKVIIEEPLLRSNNIYTVETLLRYNTLVCKSVYDILGVVPELISSYDARAFAFPDLLAVRTHNKKGVAYTEKEMKGKKPTLFGAYPWDVDKKEVIYEKVSDIEPLVDWIYTKKKTLAKENYDMTDSYVCVRGYMNKMGYWPIN